MAEKSKRKEETRIICIVQRQGSRDLLPVARSYLLKSPGLPKIALPAEIACDSHFTSQTAQPRKQRETLWPLCLIEIM